jgi:hypothetical protein
MKQKTTIDTLNGIIKRIEGNLGSGGFKAFKNLIETARQTGASTLRIEATFGEPRLVNALVKKFGATIESTGNTGGFQDVIVVNLRSN